MTSFNLSTFLSGHVFAFLFVFARVGSVLMLMPGLGETYVSPRIRLMFGLFMSFLIMEPMLSRIPLPPDGVPDFIRLLSYEIITGLFYGTVVRLLVSVLETAGSIIGIQTGLSNATILNPSQATQSALSSAFISVAGLTLIFVTGLDHMIFRGIVATYDIFPPSGTLMPGDMAQAMIRLTNESFIIGVEMALPFVTMGLLLQVGIGLMQKLMPQVQLFMVVLPVQLWGGLALLMLTTSSMLAYWLSYFDTSITTFFTR